MQNIIRGTMSLLLLSAALGMMAADVPTTPWDGQALTCPCNQQALHSVMIENTYRGLSQGPLRLACLEALPKGVLLRAGKVSISQQQLTAEIAKVKPDMQSVLKKHGFFVLEQMATRQLLSEEARNWAKDRKRDTKKDTDTTLLQAYLTSITASMTVSAMPRCRRFMKPTKRWWVGQVMPR